LNRKADENNKRAESLQGWVLSLSRQITEGDPKEQLIQVLKELSEITGVKADIEKVVQSMGEKSKSFSDSVHAMDQRMDVVAEDVRNRMSELMGTLKDERDKLYVHYKKLQEQQVVQQETLKKEKEEKKELEITVDRVVNVDLASAVEEASKWPASLTKWWTGT